MDKNHDLKKNHFFICQISLKKLNQIIFKLCNNEHNKHATDNKTFSALTQVVTIIYFSWHVHMFS